MSNNILTSKNVKVSFVDLEGVDKCRDSSCNNPNIEKIKVSYSYIHDNDKVMLAYYCDKCKVVVLNKNAVPCPMEVQDYMKCLEIAMINALGEFNHRLGWRSGFDVGLQELPPDMRPKR